MDEVKRMYAECMEVAHSAIDRLDRYLMISENPVSDTAQRLVDTITENLMQMIAGGFAIREDDMDDDYIEEVVQKVELAQDAEADHAESLKALLVLDELVSAIDDSDAVSDVLYNAAPYDTREHRVRHALMAAKNFLTCEAGEQR